MLNCHKKGNPVKCDVMHVTRVQCLHSPVQTTWQHVTAWYGRCLTSTHHVHTITAHLTAPTNHCCLDSSW